MSTQTAFLRLDQTPQTSPKEELRADMFQHMWYVPYQVVRLALRCVPNDFLLPNFTGNVVFYVPRASFPEANVSSNEWAE